MKSKLIAECRWLDPGHLMCLIQSILLMIVSSIFAGCSAPGTVPSKGVLNDPNGNFHLYISNQSFAVSPVDIKVFIDGELVSKGLFDVGSQHTFRTFVLKLSPGQHKIVAESSKGRAKFERTFEINNKLWIALVYWSSPKSKGGVESFLGHFSVDVKEEPIYFL